MQSDQRLWTSRYRFTAFSSGVTTFHAFLRRSEDCVDRVVVRDLDVADLLAVLGIGKPDAEPELTSFHRVDQVGRGRRTLVVLGLLFCGPRCRGRGGPDADADAFAANSLAFARALSSAVWPS